MTMPKLGLDSILGRMRQSTLTTPATKAQLEFLVEQYIVPMLRNPRARLAVKVTKDTAGWDIRIDLPAEFPADDVTIGS